MRKKPYTAQPQVRHGILGKADTVVTGTSGVKPRLHDIKSPRVIMASDSILEAKQKGKKVHVITI